MTTHGLVQFSRRMATVTLILIVAMLLLNAVIWVYPPLAEKESWGLGFALTERQLSHMADTATLFPWWQKLGGILLSSIPPAGAGVGPEPFAPAVSELRAG